MITNENFQRSVELCQERESLIKLLFETNEYINYPPFTDKIFKKNYYKNHKGTWISIFIYLLVAFIFGTNMEKMFIFLSPSGSEAEDSLLLLVIALSFVIFPCMAIIIFKIIHRIYLSVKILPELNEHKKNRNQYYNEYLPVLTENRDELNLMVQSINDELKSFDGIPEENWDIANQLWYLFTTHQADNYKEAIWLWNDLQYKETQNQLALEAARYAEESRNYAYNAMVAAQEAENNSKSSLILDVYNTYQISKYLN